MSSCSRDSREISTRSTWIIPSAERNPFGRPVAHGLLGLAIASGLMSQAPRVDTLAFLAILEWRFHHPIFFGDTIHGVSRVEALEPQGNGRRGVVTWHRRIFNQDGQAGSGRPYANPGPSPARSKIANSDTIPDDPASTEPLTSILHSVVTRSNGHPSTRLYRPTIPINACIVPR